MDENQIALETAKIVLATKQSQLLSDLIKVGIPSLIAIISGIVTYKISVNNSNVNVKLSELSKTHEEKIAKLNFEQDITKIIDERRYKLFTEIANDLVVIIDSNDKYLSRISTKRHIVEKEDKMPHTLNKSLIDVFLNAVKEKDGLLKKVIASALLTGNKELVIKLN